MKKEQIALKLKPGVTVKQGVKLKSGTAPVPVEMQKKSTPKPYTAPRKYYA